jgi:acyl dehydratase
MPLSSVSVGAATAPIRHEVDARWIMAYAAALGDFNPRYMDTQADRVVAHPLFPVCLEWPAILASRELPGSETLTAEERARTVHAAHDLHVLRPIVAGEVLSTQAHLIGLRAIKPGAAQVLRLDTRDARGALVCRTYQLSISRGVPLAGEPCASEEAPATPVAGGSAVARRMQMPVAEGLAHVYTEGARIWNPIHTDRAVALDAGLPDIILHGTATLAMAVTRLVDEYLGRNPVRVRRIGGRFRAMVRMPSILTLEVAVAQGALYFEVLTAEGEPAVSDGFLLYE